jgi:cytochrome b561
MQLRNSPSRYGLVSIVLHWGVALAVFGLFGLGLWMVGLDYYAPGAKPGRTCTRASAWCCWR